MRNRCIIFPKFADVQMVTWNSDSEFSNSSRVCYIHWRTNNLKKGMNLHSPPRYGFKSLYLGKNHFYIQKLLMQNVFIKK